MTSVRVDLCDGRGPTDPDAALSAHPELRDLPYFREVAEAAGAAAPEVDRFILSYGSGIDRGLSRSDVWFLIGDEKARPIPWRPPCPVFRTHGDRFHHPRRGWHADPVLALGEGVLLARNWLMASLAMWPHPLSRPASAGWLPLGHPGLSTVPAEVPPISARPFDVGFRGSLGGGRGWSPRTITRVRMRAALDRLSPAINRDLLATTSFLDSFGRVSDDYADALASTKICLVPRGGSLETYRLFEAAFCGCVLITEPLSPAWYYGRLPHRELRTWSDLPDVVDALLADSDRLQKISTATRVWADEVISAAAIGRWVAAVLHEQTVPGRPARVS